MIDKMLPEWMEQPYRNDDAAFQTRRRHNHFVQKSLRNLQKSLNEQMLTERYARYPGILQQINPSVKLVFTLGLIIFTGLTRNLIMLAVIWVLSLLLMIYSRLPAWKLQVRIWSFIPAITFLLAIPGMLNIFNDGTPLLVIYKAAGSLSFMGMNLPDTLYLSQQGTMAGLFLCIRTGLSITMGALLVASTPASGLFKSLRILHIPDLFIMIIDMSYRYVGVLINISIEMFEARTLRTVGFMSPRTQRAQIGSSIAALFNRSMGMAEEVYQAMAARCYTGEKVAAADGFKDEIAV